MKLTRWELSLVVGMIVAILLSSLGAFGSEWEETREEVLRLHLLANSDSPEDQALKLAVRDVVLEETQGLFGQEISKAELEVLALAHLDEIAVIAQQEIYRQGYDYPVEAQLVNMYFDTRSYDGFTFPAGSYDAVRLVIGEGEGQNWWCVMFPPMCLPAVEGTDALPLEERILHLGETPQYLPKFAVVELVETLRERSRED